MVSARKLIKAFMALLTLLALSGCQTVSFYTQGVVGHSQLMLARQPVDKVLKTADTELADKLTLTKELKEFAIRELALPDNKSYSTYVPLNREYPVWVVVAASQLSLEPKQWCYLIIGCASYRGYFSKSSAYEYAAKLKEQDWEVYVGGAAAYSTLGWFADPLLPTMMRGDDSALAELIFHELAHQKLYVKGDSEFNESMATVVGERGALRWLKQQRPNSVKRYQGQLQAQRQFSELVTNLKRILNQIYKSDADLDKKLAFKRNEIQAFRSDYEKLKSVEWSGRGYFDNWISSEINNAKLASFSTYYARAPEFNLFLDECNGDFWRFFASLEDNKGVIPKACK